MLIDQNTTRENLSARLEAYNKVRYERSVTVAILGRVDDMSREKMVPTLKKFVPTGTNPASFPEFAWPVDVAEDARKALTALAL